MKTKRRSLGEVASITAGQSPPGHTYNEDGVGLPFFQGKADFGEVNPVARRWCAVPKKIAETGDILISVRAPVGPTNIAGERCCIGRGLAAIRPDESLALRDFVLWTIKYREPELVANGQGSTFTAIGQKYLSSFPIFLPPLDEQRRIVAILNRAAKIERLQAQADERLQEFIPALFTKMFGDPGENPMGWPLHTLRELSTLGPQYGANARSVPYFKGQPRYIRITDIQEGGSLSNEPVGLDLVEWEPYRLYDGDLLFARSGTVGKAYIHRQKDSACVFAGYLIRFRLDESRLHPQVAFAFTQTAAYMRWVESRRHTTSQPNINGQEYATLKIPVPPLDKQRRFVEIVETAQTTVSRVDSGQKIASVLNASLMAHLLEAGA